jgi:hypothetical protein
MVLVTKKQRTLPIHHQKRHGDHHKRTKPYEKTYWPYLPLLAVAGVTMMLNLAWPAISSHATGNVLGASTGITQYALLTDTNHDRQVEHAGNLTLNTDLAAAAQAKAQDMASKNYWSHVSPNGTSPWQFINQTGYRYRAAGENLAYGFTNSDEVVRGWMNSREHRTNLLNTAYQNVGFGVVQAPSFQGSKQQTIVVAMYGQPTADSGIAPSVVGNDLPSKQVVRLDLYAGNALPGALYMLLAVTFLAASVIVLRHVKLAHRAFAYSEAFIVRHPMLDVVMVTIAAAGILFSRTAGFIH